MICNCTSGATDVSCLAEIGYKLYLFRKSRESLFDLSVLDIINMIAFPVKHIVGLFLTGSV